MNEEIINRASYILLYELMIMLIQQNGNVVGVDIATLLLRNKEAHPYEAYNLKPQDVGRRESLISQRSEATGGDGSTQDISTIPEKTEIKQRKTVEQMTDEFRNTLLYGLVQEALEYAMNEGLWGHALFLASKLDKRTYASVMTRFANSLPPHDPLQTLYQLHSGRVPAIVTCVADPRWDDWRPHLAMIISNTSANPEVNRRSITTLGDTLFARGDVHAAHFCYILAQTDFGAYGNNGVKLVLIGANHNKPYLEFLTTEAIMLTEIYEYARNLSDPYFTLIDLQTFKFDLAVKMVDCGLIEKALLYIEQIATNITNDPSKYKRSFIEVVYVLGDRIKYHDPVCKNSVEDVTNLIWLNKLAEVVGKCQDGEIIESETYSSKIEPRTNIQNQEIREMKHQELQQQLRPPPAVSQQQWNTAQPEYGNGPISMMEVNTNEMQSDWQPISLPTNIQDTYDSNAQYMRNMDEPAQYQQPQQQDYWNQQSYYGDNYGRDESTSNWQQQPTSGLVDQTDIDNTQQEDKWNYEAEREDKTPTPEPTPTISMVPSMAKQYDPLEELDALDTPNQANAKSSMGTKKMTEKAAEKKAANNSGWLGGLISKFTPKPKNQMILPDDNDPKIIWDKTTNQWLNKDEVGGNGNAASIPPPPPKLSDMSYRTPTMEYNSQPPLPGAHNEDASAMDVSTSIAGCNKYKMSKSRSMRKKYVDVMNPDGNASSNIPTSNVRSPMPVPMATSSPHFNPAPTINEPIAPMDILTPAPTSIVPSGNTAENASQTLSRWSSTSSLSREVQSYTMRDPRLLQRNKGPMMFNPSDLKDRSVKNMPPGRYPPL